ncbi:MAG: hypothetical protein IJW23_01110 [Lentisphaeria bacterium]|nr:hypothetical protein [Lentisphaeria bacterium]
MITDITQGSCAEKYGIKRNDPLLAYADVELLSENNNERDVIQEFRDKEKKLIFARRMDNGSFKIFEQTFPAGTMGIHMQELWISG